uniref:RING-type domain-containing protein n=1 Tax=Caenorhabditis tropicalis TaxID=1561998 RepID=A0A1I7TT75_9PELO
MGTPMPEQASALTTSGSSPRPGAKGIPDNVPLHVAECLEHPRHTRNTIDCLYAVKDAVTEDLGIPPQLKEKIKSPTNSVVKPASKKPGPKTRNQLQRNQCRNAFSFSQMRKSLAGSVVSPCPRHELPSTSDKDQPSTFDEKHHSPLSPWNGWVPPRLLVYRLSLFIFLTNIFIILCIASSASRLRSRSQYPRPDTWRRFGPDAPAIAANSPFGVGKTTMTTVALLKLVKVNIKSEEAHIGLATTNAAVAVLANSFVRCSEETRTGIQATPIDYPVVWRKYLQDYVDEADNKATQDRRSVTVLLGRTVPICPKARYALIGDVKQLSPYAENDLQRDLKEYAVGTVIKATKGQVQTVDITTVYRCPYELTKMCQREQECGHSLCLVCFKVITTEKKKANRVNCIKHNQMPNMPRTTVYMIWNGKKWHGRAWRNHGETEEIEEGEVLLETEDDDDDSGNEAIIIQPHHLFFI